MGFERNHQGPYLPSSDDQKPLDQVVYEMEITKKSAHEVHYRMSLVLITAHPSLVIFFQSSLSLGVPHCSQEKNTVRTQLLPMR